MLKSDKKLEMLSIEHACPHFSTFDRKLTIFGRTNLNAAIFEWRYKTLVRFLLLNCSQYLSLIISRKITSEMNEYHEKSQFMCCL